MSGPEVTPGSGEQLPRPHQPGDPIRPIEPEVGAVDGDRRPGDVAWTGENRPELGPRIYVASLTDYNAGILHGSWVLATVGPEVMTEAIEKMLAESPTAKRYGEPAEEWRIDDFDGWGRYLHVREYESLETIARLAEGLEAHGEAFGAWAALCDTEDAEELDRFEEVFLGEFGSLEAYGESICEDMGIDLDDFGSDLPEGFRPYLQFDVAGWVRDLELGSAIATMESSGGVYVFGQ